jgi:acyl-[acyl-carrier-protein]-phospholipid O-acyltransferase/long-chain-fatty-acid--[acyl-carrier-protein] ligase
MAEHPLDKLVFQGVAVILSEFAPLVSGTLAAKREIVTLFLLVFSISIARSQ